MESIKTSPEILKYTTFLPLSKHFSCVDNVKKFKSALIMVKKWYTWNIQACAFKCKDLVNILILYVFYIHLNWY